MTESSSGESSGVPMVAMTTRARTLSMEVESVVNEDKLQCCGCGWSRNARTFLVSLILFSTITMAQTVGALIANSMALLADCASMALDAVTYAINLFAECKPEPDVRRNRRNQLISSGVSFAALIAITSFFFYQGLVNVIDRSWDGSDGGDDVNPYIVFAFAVTGIVFDLLSLLPYCLYGCPCIKKKVPATDEDSTLVAEKMNLCSALMHVSADLLRSCTTFTESILIWGYGINGDAADAWATVIVSGTILLGTVKPIIDWCSDLREYRAEPFSVEITDGLIS